VSQCFFLSTIALGCAPGGGGADAEMDSSSRPDATVDVTGTVDAGAVADGRGGADRRRIAR
jgi:hypothetical protein